MKDQQFSEKRGRARDSDPIMRQQHMKKEIERKRPTQFSPKAKRKRERERLSEGGSFPGQPVCLGGQIGSIT